MISLFDFRMGDGIIIRIDLPEAKEILIEEPNGNVLHLIVNNEQWAKIQGEVSE